MHVFDLSTIGSPLEVVYEKKEGKGISVNESKGRYLKVIRVR